MKWLLSIPQLKSLIKLIYQSNENFNEKKMRELLDKKMAEIGDEPLH